MNRAPFIFLRLFSLLFFISLFAACPLGQASPDAHVSDAGEDDAGSQDAGQTSEGPWLQVSAGGTHSCAIARDHSLWCWGANDQGQLGQGDHDSQAHVDALPVSGLSDVRFISAGWHHSCAALGDGTAWCWGLGDMGQIGDGSTDGRLAPTQVAQLDQVVEVHAGAGHSCAVESDGLAYCWGLNEDSGMLGNGQVGIDSFVPSQVSVLTGVESLSLSGWHSCALNSQGQAWCWGTNWDGELGDGSDEDRAEPVQVATLQDVRAVASGDSHSCAIEGSQLFCWGGNSDGQLGTGGSEEMVTAPQLVEDLTQLSSVELNLDQSCAIAAGQIYCWGNNAGGQLGALAESTSNIPVPIAGLDDMQQVSTGERHSCALSTAGRIWCWGDGSMGQVGAQGTMLAPQEVLWPEG